MNLYDWLKEKDNDYDTYDTVYDICVTVCVPYEVEENRMEWYDKFCNFILKHVDVIEETSDYECIADWNKFIEDNAETFKKIIEESWSYMPDDEDFNCEWIEEMHKLLAGYGSEETYHYLMRVLSEDIKEN